MKNKPYDLMFFKDLFAAGSSERVSYECNVGAVYVAGGAIRINGVELNHGEGGFVSGPFTAQPTGAGQATLLRWDIAVSEESGETSLNQPGIAACSRVDRICLASNEVVVRLDTVTFPPGSRAYRHVHAAPGTRYLLSGSLEINSDHCREMVGPGDAWFEAENSPVLAVADEKVESIFVRVLVLSPEYLGKPTITYVDPDDNGKPRQQVNNRLVDQLVRLEA